MSTWRFPAEFEPHEAIWLSWAVRTDKNGHPPQAVQKAIIAALAGHVNVHLVVQNALEEESVRQELKRDGVPADHVRFFAVPHGEMWIRDFGPIFLTSADGRATIAEFGFGLWGFLAHTKTPLVEEAITDGLVPRRVASQMRLPCVRSSLFSEGGNREFNGRGTVLLSEVVERGRNPNMTLDEMEQELKRVLGVTNVIWMKKGPAEDYGPWRGHLPGSAAFSVGTDGHVDEFVRFVDPSTILLCSVPEDATGALADANRANMEENLRILENSRDQDGKPFKIIRLPLPDPIFMDVTAEDALHQFLQEFIYDDGAVVSPDRPATVAIAASYGNFLVTNGVVLMPRYYREGGDIRHKHSDEVAQKILQDCFPDRRIVALDTVALNIGGGGIHCITQQQPRV
eukprot:TRINITY_DN4474_c0_g3_i1.p1 TRINITY_DN4474_c0_g3~~TRINITY_DN4474_c0_g3_i1.p1  ORF type:complete len:399 (-),score=122.69 TRINITY_DN4474_c0_g3_i1:309-1505(-)